MTDAYEALQYAIGYGLLVSASIGIFAVVVFLLALRIFKQRGNKK